MKIRFVWLLPLLLLNVACLRQEAQFELILKLENGRQPCQDLQPFLNSPEPTVRARTAEAMGKLQDSTCTSAVIRLLADVNHNVRAEAAFALGQMGSVRAEHFLVRKLFSKDVVDVKTRIIEALGKLGGRTTVPVLQQHLGALEPEIRGEAALAVARLALRNIRHATLTKSTAALLSDPNASVRWKAAYALMRIGRGLEPKALQAAMQDEEPLVRMYAIRALGTMRRFGLVEPIARLLREDPDWRVRVDAARVLGSYPLRLTANYFSLLNQQQPVRQEIIKAIGASAALEAGGYRANSRELNWAKSQLEEVFKNYGTDPIWTAAEVGFGLTSYASLMGNAGASLITRFTTHASGRIQARAFEALGSIGSLQTELVFERSFRSAPPIAKVAMLNAIKESPGEAGNRLFLSALQESDEVLVGLAADGLSADTSKNHGYSKKILEAYERLQKPIEFESVRSIFRAFDRFRETDAIPSLQRAMLDEDSNVARAAASALESITGERPPSAELIGNKEQELPPYDLIAGLEGASALINTSGGVIEVELYTQDAPMTVLNFVTLARTSFYDSLAFHRVVPNFVVQTGDPRNDGWGSPGYTIRSEFNKRSYGRGTVGMASSGKDTEGSQFFITHSPQPHLDGRYTVFGQVIAGMDVVDAIQEGDIITSIAIRARPFITGL